MLDLVAAHHVTLLEVLPDARDPEDAASMCTAAAEFLTEVLASFAMASSAFAGAREQLQQAQDEVAVLRSRLEALGQP
jgi:ubiquinone biosynthesis protein UbiJ